MSENPTPAQSSQSTPPAPAPATATTQAAPATSSAVGPIAPPNMIAKIMAAGLASKAMKKPADIFWMSLTGGAFIGLGFIFYVTTMVGGHEYPWYGIVKVIAGLTFSVGLILVVITGADLFTSTTMTVVPLAEKTISFPRWASHWGIVYVGNFVGALGTAALVFFSGAYKGSHGAWGIVVLDAVQAKVSHAWFEALLLGILANWAVCLAVWAANAGVSLADKVLAIVGPIALFVSAGFEHSIANMFLIPLGLMIKNFAPDAFWTATDAVPAWYSDITVGSFLWDNLIPVTIGNIVGGAVLVGLYYRRAFLKKPAA